MSDRNPRKRPRAPVPSPAEDKAITAAAATDPDNPPVTDEEFSAFRPATEVAPELVAEYRRTRGRQKAPTKQQVTLRLDPDVVDHFKATGRGWQTRLNDTLRRAVFDRKAG